ncbi:MAG: N5-glutamine methyltransferase family protein, partial [Planctomycetia bacterium]
MDEQRTQDEVWTVGRLLSWTAEWLAARGSESPRLDAEVLLAHVRGCPRIALYTAFDTPVSDDQRGRFRGLVKRRGDGEPVAYLVGEREFFSLPFAVGPAVLGPRPETEGRVVRVLDLCRSAPPAGRPPRIV